MARRVLVDRTFKTELFFLPLDFMAKTYSDGVLDNKYTEHKKRLCEYFVIIDLIEKFGVKYLRNV